MAQQFILLIEMSAKHLCRLVHRVLNLHRDPSTRLGFLDNLLDRSEKSRSILLLKQHVPLVTCDLFPATFCVDKLAPINGIRNKDNAHFA